MYWIDNNYCFDLSGINKIDKNLPVSHINYYEANAFANYAKKRIPSEYEIEIVLKRTEKMETFLRIKFLEKYLIKTSVFHLLSLVTFGFGHQVIIIHTKVINPIK